MLKLWASKVFFCACSPTESKDNEASVIFWPAKSKKKKKQY